jgi:hypothetical protein
MINMKTSFTIVLTTILALTIASCDLTADSASGNVVIVNDGTDTVYVNAMTILRSTLVDLQPEMLRDGTSLPSITPGYWAVLQPVSAYKQESGVAVFVYRPLFRNDSSLIVLDTLIQKPYAELLQSKYVRIP